MRKKKILVVDDNKLQAERVKRFLEAYKKDTDVSFVESGEQCLIRLERENYDIIISDYEMSLGMNGLELLKKLNKRNNNHPAFILFTAPNNRDIVKEAFEHGADDYFMKGEFAFTHRLLNSVSRAADKNLNLKWAYFDTIRLMKKLLEIYSPSLRKHSRRVSVLSGRLAKMLGRCNREVKLIKLAALFHDIGKMSISKTTFLNPDVLLDEQLDEMKQHTIAGEAIIKKVKVFSHLGPIIRHHHEWYDGSGYPDNLKGAQIELPAKIIAVADAYEAMLTSRPYRRALEHREIIEEFRRHSGTQFDPKCVRVLHEYLFNKKSCRLNLTY